jgi:GDP-D-mannose dehydratase
LLGDPTTAERELGWSARVSIDHAVEELVRDYRARKQP